MYRALLGALVLGLAACNLAVKTDPAPVSSPTLIPDPSATPTPSPTPEPVVRNQAGRKALAHGDWDLALLEFGRVIAESQDEKVVGEALYGRGEALLRAEQYPEARQAFSELISLHPGHESAPSAHLLRAQASFRLGDAAGAIPDYEEYLSQRPGIIDPYVNEWLGDSLRVASRPLDSVALYEAALQAPQQLNELRLKVKIGRAYLEAGEFEAALAQFEAVKAAAEDGSTRASMNLLAAEALEGLGDLEGMYARLTDSFVNYPAAFDSYVGLVRLVNDGIPVDDYQRGLVDYFAGAYEPALSAFNRAIETNPTPAAFYYRGLTYRSLGNAEAAVGDFGWATGSYPDDPNWPEVMLAKAATEWAWLGRYSAAVETLLELVAARPQFKGAAEALYSAGRTAERTGDLARAAEIWSRAASEYPGDTWASEAAFQAGIALYRQGDFGAARSAFEGAHSISSRSDHLARAHLWIGKTDLAAGDEVSAHEEWEQAAQADPTGYYSLRAEQLLEGKSPVEYDGVFDFSTDVATERQGAEQWLRETFIIDGPDPLAQLDEKLASDPRLVRGVELASLGMVEEARSELGPLRLSLAADAEGTYRLMHTLLDLGLYREAIFAARQILDLAGMDDAATLDAPVYFNRVRFGPYYGELILPEAARYGLDGLFLLSVVRQESLFEGFATSSAAARGLMQVIPGTGDSIAGQLGWPLNYETSDLYRPLVSVRFGTYYLGAQRDRFEGDLYAALAAYNAGPGNAILWKEIAPDDPDLFLEVVRLAEPRRYIQVISEVFEIYQRLYVRN